jgi:hypothetical protein
MGKNYVKKLPAKHLNAVPACVPGERLKTLHKSAYNFGTNRPHFLLFTQMINYSATKPVKVGLADG